MLQFGLSASNQRFKYSSARHTRILSLEVEEGGGVQAQLTEFKFGQCFISFFSPKLI